MKTFHKNRLLKLADFLEALRPTKEKTFSMDYWSMSYRDDEGNICKTSACACGWATTIPSFRRAGLHLFRRQGNDGARLHYERRSGFGAAMEFFGLNLKECYLLFSPEDYEDATPKMVARRIRRFIKGVA